MLSFSAFLQQAAGSPVLAVTVLLTLGVILVNGWTDAPNAVATCVATRCLTPKQAIALAAVFNFFGVLVMCLVNATVAQTVFYVANFSGDTAAATAALCAALTAIVVWAVAAWAFGIPTSESHALIAGLSGAAIALQNGINGINITEWKKVLLGLLLSSVMGFALGFLSLKIVRLAFRRATPTASGRFFRKAEIAGAAGMAFMHGAQDGQKFIGVFLLGVCLAQNAAYDGVFQIPVWLMVLCSAVMSLGTAVGGTKIMKTVGMDMVKIKAHQGFCADLSAVVCLFLLSLWGVPASTTHAKTCALVGVGAAKSVFQVKWQVVEDLVYTWLLTFPGCGLIGYGMAKLFTFLLF